MIKDNLDNVKKRIELAGGHGVKIVAATKYVGAVKAKEAILAGVDAIGENRVQDAASKFPGLPPVDKHMIGHLQTNKVKEAVRLFDCIQSVDSVKLAKEIDKRTGRRMPVMIQVNIGREPQKYGIAPEDAYSFYDKISGFENLNVVGLMGIVPLGQDARQFFCELKNIHDEMNLRWLSMGMSNDYELAVAEGSNMIRIGSRLFEM